MLSVKMFTIRTVTKLCYYRVLFRDLCHIGLPCRVLKLRSNNIQKLDMVGRFMRLNTLNLDFCTSLTSLQKDCFSCMPNLMCLSMCETRVANLWTTTEVLVELPSLLELRFQNCLCCKDTGPCILSSREKVSSNVINTCSCSAGETTIGFLSLRESFMVPEVHRKTDNSSKVDERKFSGYLQDRSDGSPSPLHNLRVNPKLQNEARRQIACMICL